MEQQLNKSGDRRGMHKFRRTGAEHPKAKGWILYKDGEQVGYYSTLAEAAKETCHTLHYLWILANGKAINKDGSVRAVTSEGWSIKPAKTIEFVGNK
jgi:hypothetical protein